MGLEYYGRISRDAAIESVPPASESFLEEHLPTNRARRSCFFILSFSLLAVSPVPLSAQPGPATETGNFRLHKFEQPIGEEAYTFTRDGATLTLKSDFVFTDRGTKVPLTATLVASQDYTPQSFVIKGSTSRISQIDSEVQVSNGGASIRQEKQGRTVAAPASFFTISGYAPVAMQMAMMRYWRAHGSPAVLATLPSGEVKIQDRGSETMDVGGRKIQVERYNVRGLIWGLETLWMDGDNNLAALVSTDAEFDHFEALREEYEPALASFVASAARDEMATLAELSQKLPGRRTGTFAFTGATLIDGTGKPPVANATVVTRNGKIVAAGPSNQVKVPADAQRLDVAGKYIIPGLWDMHAHYEQVEWGPIYLAAGVTTVRDVGNEFEFITAVRDAVNSGNALGPHMLLAGVVDGDSQMALGIARVNSPADAAMWVKKYHDAGFQQIKIYSSVKEENVKAICADAHQLGMTVTGHIPNGMTAYDGVNDGMDQINHINYVLSLYYPKDYNPRKATPEERKKAMESIDVNSPEGRQIVAFFKQHGTVIDPTIALMEFFTRPADKPYSDLEPGAAKVAPELREQINGGGVPPDQAAQAQLSLQRRLEIIEALHKAGVPIVAGTDQAVPGYSVYREIELYAQAGFTPMEALQAATLAPARVMKVDRESGTVEAGKRADLDILDANPLENIHNVRSVHWVVANGVLYDPAPLWESVGFKP
jgi:imidazolonepropionase-like amidohydrolase